MAQVKETNVTISGEAVIKSNVYGGGELGTVRDNAHVTITGGTVRRDVYGGGYGSEDNDIRTIFNVKEPNSTNTGYDTNTYAFTPMQFAGCVGKSTTVNMSSGYVRKSVYGGGEMASVGIINCQIDSDNTAPGKDKVVVAQKDGKYYFYKNMVKHWDEDNEFALSWPFEFIYMPTFDGATHINITGGRIGTTQADDYGTDNGDVYGGGKGFAGDYDDFAFCANVGSTEINIDYTNDNDKTLDPATYWTTGGNCIAGAVYGGGENGHVMGDTDVTLTEGLVGHGMYGGGSGKDQYEKSLLKIGADYGSTNSADHYTRKIYSITAGKVFGNTNVTMTGGYVVRNVYGGGTMGSVGKGNYAGGTDDYATGGYGENAGGTLWDKNNDNSKAFMNSGICTVKIHGGTVGYTGTKDGLPYGNVFGGCRGDAAPNITESPRYLYYPEFFVGYANETIVEIGAPNSTTGPTIWGSVYGGGQDGHVRRDATVTINSGTIGKEFTGTANNVNDIEWLHSGNVYGAGSGIGQYTYTYHYFNKDNVTETSNSTSAGSVTRFTKVDVKGGTIYRNVYGGGSLASVGAPKIDQEYEEYRKGDTAEGHGQGKQTINEIIISGGQIGGDYSYLNGNYVYGGRVFGGSRGDATLDATKFSTSMFTSVSINANANDATKPAIAGSVFGGGEVGIVKGSVDVTLNGGTVEHDVYGGGALANTNTETSSEVPYTTTVNLKGGTISGDAYGGGLGQKTGFNGATSDIEAVVYGDISVNLGSSGGSSATAFNVTKYADEGHVGIVKSGRIFGCNNLMGSPQGNVTVDVWKTVKGNIERTTETNLANNKTIIKNNPDNYESVTGFVTPTYHVAAVYGGGNLADYTATGKKTNVIIETCDISIRDVYGGGNAAKVPGTDVLVKGAYEIQDVFGGGNGKDPYTNGTEWIDNPGADIDGNANTLLTGGYIHEAYGGSNEKGTITGNVSIDIGTGGACTLDVEKMVGAGKNADVNGNLIMILGCKPGTVIPVLYAGADNANVNGDVELTITSGRYGKVFGGNNMGGIIMGHIKLNIEETGECETPIEIDELYLGGNQAMYSQYGYYNSGTTEAPIYKARTAEMAAVSDDPSSSTYNTESPNYHPALTAEDYGGTAIRNTAPYDAPKLNVISATYIGKVFGGGYGTGATLYGNPIVNINMIPGSKADGVHTFMTTDSRLTALNLDADDNPNKLGVIGDVYGGGNAADVIGNPTVNIGTTTNVTMNTEPTHLGTIDTNYTYNETTKKYTAPVVGAYIVGNVFGGGMGKDDTFTCEKAMIGIDGDGVDNPDGGTTVNIYNGTVLGSVYGGGEIGRVEKNTVVTIGNGDGVDATENTPTSAPEIRGSVFGGGKGKETHGYSALVRGNPTVTVQGNAKVRGNVYGGGQIASVARYSVAKTDAEGAPYGVKKDEPYALKTNTSGFCNVTIKGYAEIGPETIGEEVNTTSVGHVFGAGKGILPAFVQDTSKRMVAVRDSEGHITGSDWDTFTGGEADYITFVKTLALSSQTNVTIDGNAKVKGSVFGGSESGFVQFDANVNVLGGTIGTADKGGADFGNVYGGGKGDVEYTGANHDYITAGIVKGNTKIVISQAEGKTTKILHNVYGGGAYGTVGEFEYDATTGIPTARKTYTVGTEVHNTTGGKAEIYITGGTIGTNGNENGMIFGSSRGDVGEPGSIHDKAAWVYDTHVAIGDTLASTTTTTTPLVKGSVYGGGENGHNFHNAYVRINGGTIGITEGEPIGSYTAGGASYPYRGNVYGGGCGTDTYKVGTVETYNPLAGIVRGNATITITGGQVVHNVYGAGAMGSVGNFEKDATNAITFNSGGTTTIAISGGTIGVDGTAGEGNVYGAARGDKAVTDRGLALVKETSVTISGTTTATQIKGNVYGGGEVGNVHTNTTVDVQGGTIARNVFGGGKGVEDLFTCEQAMVGVDGEGACEDPDSNANKNKGTSVTISNGTVGTLNNGTLVEGTGNVYGGGEIGRVEWNTQVTIGESNPTGNTVAPVIYGSVFGAGKGLDTHGYSALVRGNSTVTVQGNAKVEHNVYGGGEKSTVGRYWVKNIPTTLCGTETAPEAPAGLPDGMPYQQRSGGICRVTVQGSAQIGPDAGATTDAGHVFGAGKGVNPHYDASTSKKMINTNQLVSFEATTGKTAEDLYLEFLQTLALVTNTYVTIDGDATIKGSVYGGSESGFVQTNTDVDILDGTINGDAFGGGLGLASFAEAGKVKGNTDIAVSGGAVMGNVYGGGSLGDVGIIDKTEKKDGQLTYNYYWKKTDGTTANDIEINQKADLNTNTGICKVKISGGTIGINGTVSTEHGNVFGAGRGSSTTWWCEKAIAYATDVSVTKGTVYGNIYGGGQIGRVEDDAKVTIGVANATGDTAPTITGSVFGAGAGVLTHGYSALVRGNSNVTVQGVSLVGESVYGGGEIASVGKFFVDKGLPKHPLTGGTCTVTIQDNAKIGSDGTGHNVFGACKGVTPAFVADGENRSKSMQLLTNAPENAPTLWSHYNNDENSPFIWRYYPDEAAYIDFLETLALTSHPIVTIAEDATVNGSVFGGGERGITLGSVEVNMNGGTVTEDVYGGGSLANSNKGNWDEGTWADGKVVNGKTEYTTAVNLHSGTINSNVYGGGLGDATTAALVYGDVTVKLNETTATDNCVVNGNIFGCNNVNGTPKGHATVHVFKTANSAKKSETPVASRTTYDVAAVFGGGKSADYVPEDATQSTEVIIEGCDLTSIKEVYGGGYGAATPGTNVLIKGTYIIDNVFGGGYGASTDTYTNPGANVGYRTKAAGEETLTAYTSGDGKAIVQLMAGTVNNVYGGSNTMGDIRGGSSVTNVANDDSAGSCQNLSVGEIYGGGKSADMYGGAEIVLGCMPDDWIGAIYAGAENADVGGDVGLTLTSGMFERVFGGNNKGGKIDGYIEVNIEENPDCSTPIIIGGLYGGGNMAPYTVPAKYLENNPNYQSPRVNVRAFTSIGNIYGGGFGADAKVTGNPLVNINVIEGGRTYAGETKTLEDGSQVTLYPRAADSKMGVIGNVFGGGNEAPVDGNTNVRIGTESYVKLDRIVAGETNVDNCYTRSGYGTEDSPYVYTKASGTAAENTVYYMPVVGADIRGNVFGAGNNAKVTGNTDVQIGAKK
jgi:hypothetical protein